MRKTKSLTGRARASSIPATKTLKREGKLIMDESDSYGVEMALQLVDKAGGGEVTLVSMAPNNEVRACAPRSRWGRPRPSSYPTRRLLGSDALSTAKVLAAAIGRTTPDLVITATESSTATPAPCPSNSPSCWVCRR
jgi:electron transfer flavoprotein beta subunit